MIALLEQNVGTPAIEEARQVIERAEWQMHDDVDWPAVERAVEVLARAHVDAKANESGYTTGARRGGSVPGTGNRWIARVPTRDANDYEARQRAAER